jgi:transposase
VDYYIIHNSIKAQKWLSENEKFKLLFLPVNSPWHDKIEKLWHAMHETITRNHQCKNMDELLEQVYYFIDSGTFSGWAAWAEVGVSQLESAI